MKLLNPGIWTAVVAAAATAADTCSSNPTRLHITDGPYENYFYSDCHSQSHVVVTSPLASSDLKVIGPRLLVGWPAGNSGVVSYFSPVDGADGSLGIRLQSSNTSGEALDGIYVPDEAGTGNPLVGISGSVTFNSSAKLTVPILGSIRVIREYTEGKRLHPELQEAIRFSESEGGGATLDRTWLDNVTTSSLTYTPIDGAVPVIIVESSSTTPVLQFGAGTYRFNAAFNFPQMDQLSPQEVLNTASQGLVQQYPEQTTMLSFLSYTNKLLAGSWRFLTYFGRDSMLSLLLLQPILSDGENGAVEAVINAVLERINQTDGTVCHEEVIGDFATIINAERGKISAEPLCDYKMVDTDFFLPVVMKNYFVDTETGQARKSAFFDRTSAFQASNAGRSLADLAQLNAEKIMRNAAPFASQGGQTKANMIRLKEDEGAGNWRDSWDGLAGGRYPYDVNTALVPAALRSIAALSRDGFFPAHTDWSKTADQYAEVWEEETLRFFQVTVPRSEAVSLVDSYKKQISFAGPSHSDNITEDVTFYGLALDGENSQPIVRTMNTDDCFRHFLLNTTNQTQLSAFLSQTADHIIQPFPVGLSTSVGLFVSNPAYGGNDQYAKIFTNVAYHGTVVWSWQLAMMGAGLARQLGRCQSSDVPDFCRDTALHAKVLDAYNYLWDIIDKNRALLTNEVWSWIYNGDFVAEPLGALTDTESNIAQLWSLTFLAVHRESFPTAEYGR